MARAPRTVHEMEGSLMDALFNRGVGKLDRRRDSVEIGGGHPQVELLGKRLAFGLPLVHVLESLKEEAVHALAVEEGCRRFFRSVSAQIGSGIVEQRIDVGFIHPQLLQLVEMVIVHQLFGKIDGIDTAGRRSDEHVYYDSGANGPAVN